MAKSPAAILYDSAGTEKATAGNPLRTDPTGSTTQPISATALPLPTGASTEATLLAADERLTTIDAVLDSIKDTDGIKKITDQLPAGTNEIGKVAQGTKAAGSGAWPQVLYDAIGNAVGVVLDGTIYRLQAQAKIVRASDGAQINPATNEQQTDGTQKAIIRGGAKGTTPAADITSSHIDDNRQGIDTRNYGTGTNDSQQVEGLTADGSPPVGNPVWVGGWDGENIEALDTVPSTGRLMATLYTPDGDPVSFPSTSSSIKNDFVRSGGSESLLVNGSVTPVVFTYEADPIYDISLQEMRLTMAANGIPFGSNYFGTSNTPLVNGLLIQVVTHGITVTLYNLLQNESFVNFASSGGFEWVVSSKDLMSSDFLIGGGLKLEGGTADKVMVTVRDNLTAAGNYFKCFVKGNLLGA